MVVRRVDFRTAANLALLGAICLAVSVVAAFVGSLSFDRWSVAVGDGIGWGFYFAVILWFLMLPGCLVYVGVLGALAYSRRKPSRRLAIALSLGLGALPTWFWIKWGLQTDLLIPWTFCIPVAFGVLCRLPRERPLPSAPPTPVEPSVRLG